MSLIDAIVIYLIASFQLLVPSHFPLDLSFSGKLLLSGHLNFLLPLLIWDYVDSAQS